MVLNWYYIGKKMKKRKNIEATMFLITLLSIVGAATFMSSLIYFFYVIFIWAIGA